MVARQPFSKPASAAQKTPLLMRRPPHLHYAAGADKALSGEGGTLSMFKFVAVLTAEPQGPLSITCATLQSLKIKVFVEFSAAHW